MDSEQLPPPVVVPRDSIASKSSGAADRAAFGEFLVRARQARGMSLQQVGAETKVAFRFLAALERGQVEALPQGFYRRAMLRAYASAVGLDPDVVCNRYAQTFGSLDNEPSASNAAIVATPDSNRLLIGGAVVALVLGVGAGVIYETVWRGAPAEGNPLPQRPALPAHEVVRPASNDPAVPPPPANDVATAKPEAAAQPDANAPQETGGSVAATSGDPVEQPDAQPAIAAHASLTVTSNPSGAWVTVDGIGWGVTPITIPRVTAGRKVVRLTLDGFESQEQSVTAGADAGAASLSVTLSPRN